MKMYGARVTEITMNQGDVSSKGSKSVGACFYKILRNYGKCTKKVPEAPREDMKHTPEAIVSRRQSKKMAAARQDFIKNLKNMFKKAA